MGEDLFRYAIYVLVQTVLHKKWMKGEALIKQTESSGMSNDVDTFSALLNPD